MAARGERQPTFSSLSLAFCLFALLDVWFAASSKFAHKFVCRQPPGIRRPRSTRPRRMGGLASLLSVRLEYLVWRASGL